MPGWLNLDLRPGKTRRRYHQQEGTHLQAGQQVRFVQLSDPSGVYEITVFSELLAKYRDILEAGNALFIKATAQIDGQTVRLTAQGIQPLDTAANAISTGLQSIRGRRSYFGVVEGCFRSRRCW